MPCPSRTCRRRRRRRRVTPVDARAPSGTVRQRRGIATTPEPIDTQRRIRVRPTSIPV